MTAVSDVLRAAKPVAVPSGSRSEVPAEAAGVRVRGRARIPATVRDGKIQAAVIRWASVAWTDLRRAWWTPASLPTIQQAWAQRKPDRSTVPGDNGALYVAWLAFNHTLALITPLLAVVVVGALTPVVWLFQHPARFLLAAVIAAPLIALSLIYG